MIGDSMTNRGFRGLFNRNSAFELFDAFDNLISELPLITVQREFRVNVTESDEGYELTADLPGLSKDDIEIKLEDGVLSISCEHENTREDDSKSFKIRERILRDSGKFARSITLPNIDDKSVEAALDNGVLTVTMQKIADEHKKINIKVK